MTSDVRPPPLRAEDPPHPAHPTPQRLIFVVFHPSLIHGGHEGSCDASCTTHGQIIACNSKPAYVGSTVLNLKARQLVTEVLMDHLGK